MKKLLLLLPIFAFASMDVPYGKLDSKVKLDYKSHSKNWVSSEKIDASSITGDFRYRSNEFWGWNLSTTFHANIPLSNYPKDNGKYFGMNQIDENNETEAGAYLGELSLNYKGDSLNIKSFHHYINTPFIKSDDDDQLKTTVEGITTTYNIDKELSFTLGAYSRIFGAGNSLANKKGEFKTISSVISGGNNLTDNYLGIFGVNLQDEDKRYGGKFYYYQLLDYDVTAIQKNNLSLFYIDTIYAMKLLNKKKIRRGNKIISRSDTDNIIILGQAYQGTEELKNDFLVLGAKSIYRNSRSSVAYFASLSAVTGDDGGVRYPFDSVPEYTKVGDFDLSDLNSAELSYKIEAKYYRGKNNLSLYYAGFDGKDLGTVGIKNSAVYGLGVDLEFLDKTLFINGFVENQELEGVNNSVLKDNLAGTLRVKYLF